MRIQPEFPLCRVEDPMRRAEQTIYRILEESEAPGRALYEARILPHGRQIDFPVWIEGVTRYAIEAKGGRYIIDPETGEWRLLTDAGRHHQASPPAQAWGVARSIPEVIRERFHRGAYIIAVLAFPNMEPDQVIAEQIDQEVALVMPELAPRETADPKPQVVIQHVEHLHVHVGPEGVQGLSDLTGAG